MSQELQIFKHEEFGGVRVVEENGECYFVAADVCKALDIKNATQAVASLDEDERSMYCIGRQGEANVVNESGLYALEWLHEVLGKQGKIYKRGRHIYMKAPFDKEGYRTSETVTLERGKTVVNHYWTQKGRWFIYNTLKNIGIVPLDEREEKMATLL